MAYCTVGFLLRCDLIPNLDYLHVLLQGVCGFACNWSYITHFNLFWKVGERLEVLPGTEFRIAYEEAVKCGASVTLGDRPVQVCGSYLLYECQIMTNFECKVFMTFVGEVLVSLTQAEYDACLTLVNLCR